MDFKSAEDMYKSFDMPVPKNLKNPPYGGKPKYVKFAPGDTGDFLPHVFFEEPRTFQATAGPLGEIHAWGIYPYVYDEAPENDRERTDDLNWPAFDGVQAMMRQMRTQTIYGGIRGDGSPEIQFLNVLMDRKRQQLKALDLNGLDKRDVLLTVYIAGMRDKKKRPRVWRKIRVSAGIGLSTFQDKVMAPVMGWVRNLHCYTFTDFRNGALFGPVDSDSIDRVHSAQIGYEFLPDHKYKLAHLFGREGDRIGYLYDFGDKWFHNIEIDKIYPLEQSTGAIEILEGKGMCPAENLHGSLQYNDFLDEYEKGSVSEKYKKKKEILQMPNYNHFGKPPSQFDPFVFDIDAAKERLREALASTNSVRSGAKKFTMPMAPFAEEMTTKSEKKWLKKGQEIVKLHDDENFGYWHETSSTLKDKSHEAICASCGKPAAKDVQLKQCSGCRQVLYCSSEHQKAHWKTAHKRQCSRKFVDSVTAE